MGNSTVDRLDTVVLMGTAPATRTMPSPTMQASGRTRTATAWATTRTLPRSANETGGQTATVSVTTPMPSNDGSETIDSDGDGVGDNADVFPSDPTSGSIRTLMAWAMPIPPMPTKPILTVTASVTADIALQRV